MTARTAMVAAIEAANREAIAELVNESGLTPHVLPAGAEFTFTGPILLAETAVGTKRIRVLATDRDGNRYADLDLAAESVFHGIEGAQAALTEAISGGSYTVHELTVFSLARGEHHAVLADVQDIAEVFGLDALVEVPADFGWARSWATMPSISDGAGVDLVAYGVPVA